MNTIISNGKVILEYNENRIEKARGKGNWSYSLFSIQKSIFKHPLCLLLKMYDFLPIIIGTNGLISLLLGRTDLIFKKMNELITYIKFVY
jgi:hypothetical protein